MITDIQTIQEPISSLQDYINRYKSTSQSNFNTYHHKYLVRHIFISGERELEKIDDPVADSSSKAIPEKRNTIRKSHTRFAMDDTPTMANGYQDLVRLEEHVSQLVSQLRLHMDDPKHDLIGEEDPEPTPPVHKSKTNLRKTKSTLSVTFNTEKPSMSAADRLGKVEFAEFPGLRKTTMPLGIAPAKYLVQTLQHFNLPSKWAAKYKSEPLTKFMTDVFWYLWHFFWSPESRDIIKQLNDRISELYVHMFLEYKRNDKDEFFQVCSNNKHLPIVIGYSFILVCKDVFPFSEINQKDEILQKVFEVMVGIVPTSFGLEAAKPTAPPPKREKSKSILSGLLSQKNLTTVDLDTSAPSARQTTTKPPIHESAFVGVICKSKPQDFNIFQNSPLITRYLHSVGSGGEQRRIAIRRNHVLKPVIASDAKTYRSLIQDSVKSSKGRMETFQKAQDEIQKDRQKIHNDISLILNSENEKMRKILRNKATIKQVAENIIEQHQTKRKGNRVGGILM